MNTRNNTAFETDVFRRRTQALLFLLPILLLTVFLSTARFALFRRAEYLELGRRIALREGSFYPPRGRIFDSGGILLAWSERYYDLLLSADLPLDVSVDEILADVASAVPAADTGGNATVDAEGTLLRSNLTPEEVTALKPLLMEHRFLKLRHRVVRMVISDEKVRSRIGKVADHHGISGIELLYDKELSGTPCRYEVMLDRNRNWMDNTLKIHGSPVKGSDVRLSVTLKELREAREDVR